MQNRIVKQPIIYTKTKKVGVIEFVKGGEKAPTSGALPLLNTLCDELLSLNHKQYRHVIVSYDVCVEEPPMSLDTPYVDYDWIVSEFDIKKKIESGEWDEVWLVGYPELALHPTCMGGKDAFYCNGPVVPNSKYVSRRFFVMGFNSGRGVDDALEVFAHRVEFVMARVYANHPPSKNQWAKYTTYNLQKVGHAAFGTIHRAPNSTENFEYDNQTPVICSAEDWKNYPNMTNEIRVMTCKDWGDGDPLEHHRWWLSGIPHFNGKTDGIFNSWWQYIMTPDYIKG